MRQASIISVTPVPLDRDSRTLKQHLSLKRAGYRAQVIAAGRRVDDLAEGTAKTTANPPGARKPADKQKSGLIARFRVPNGLLVSDAALFLAWFLVRFLPLNVRALRHLGPARLYILHECSQYPAIAVASRMRGIPFIYDAHDFYSGIEPEAELPSVDRRFIRPFLLFLERRCVRACAGFLTVSDGLAWMLEDTFARRPVVLRNVHDPSLDVTSDIPKLKARLGIAPNETVLAVTGNRKPGQAFDALLTALSQDDGDIHLVLIGSGYADVAEKGDRLGIGERVHDLGRVHPGEIVPLLRGADFATIPYTGRTANYLNSLPNGFFQSIGAGLLVLYPPLPEIATLSRDHGLGIEVDPTSADAWSKAFHQIRNDGEMTAKLRENVEMASARLTWQVEEEIFLDLVQSTLA